MTEYFILLLCRYILCSLKIQKDVTSDICIIIICISISKILTFIYILLGRRFEFRLYKEWYHTAESQINTQTISYVSNSEWIDMIVLLFNMLTQETTWQDAHTNRDEQLRWAYTMTLILTALPIGCNRRVFLYMRLHSMQL